MPENPALRRCDDRDYSACPEERIRPHYHAYTCWPLPPDAAWLHDREGVEPCGLSGADNAARRDYFTNAAGTSGMDLRHWLRLRFAKGSSIRQPGCGVRPRESHPRSCDCNEPA